MASGIAPDPLLPIDLHRSLTDTTYDRLVDAIATHRLPPGTRLNQRDLADRLMVSRQPVSHALLRLKTSGLAMESGRKGLVVAPVDRVRLIDLYALRTEIEGLVAARAATRCKEGMLDESDLATMQRLLRFGEALDAETPVLDCITADVDFHLCLYRLCGSAVIREAIAPLWPHFRRSMGSALSIPDHRKVSWAGHARIAAAILAGDPIAARDAARSHIETAGLVALNSLDDAFAGDEAGAGDLPT